MLFDNCDYISQGVVGPQQNNAFEVFDTECNDKGISDWVDIATTFRATADAFVKAFTEYIGSSVSDPYEGATNIPCNNTLCSPGPVVPTGLPEPNKFTPAGYNDFYNLVYDMRAKWTALMDHLDDVLMNPTTVVFNQAYYDDYLTAWRLVICDVKKLMKIIDNDDFPDYIP